MSSAAIRPPATSPADAAPWARPPLTVVPQRVARRSRIATIVLCALALVATLMAILFFNIQISSGQYRLTDLTLQERALSQENEALTQDLEANSAPQNLAARANDLGMVQAQDMGSVNLGSGGVEAASGVAEKGKAVEILVPPAEMKGSEAAQNALIAAQERAEKRAKEEAARKAAERKAAQKAKDAGNLHGGTVPAPSQRAPGN